MGTALAQYFGILTAMDCGNDIVYGALSGFIGGALLTALLNMILNDMKK